MWCAKDPTSRCRLNEKYYQHIAEIYRYISQQKSSKIAVRTPSQLNNTVADGSANDGSIDIDDTMVTYYPEHVILDIHMGNNKPALVMKNWSYAIGSLPFSSPKLESELKILFDKYSAKLKKK